MIEIEIDGKILAVAEGSTIIEAADNAGIYIPRFCYHKKLSIAANCRMCLVEVEKVGKPLPACATPVSAGMKVYTRSQKALQAQRAVMEFLLINHPLDCPICDQGGECELQDLSLGYGRADSSYREPKRSVKSDNIGPLIETWMTRCIHCTRCVRFGEEIAGFRELGITGRGEDSEIGTYVKHFLRSELSGNIIDLCPVGALTNKPARYTGRSWEFREHPTVAPHDCVGSNLFVHSRGHTLVRQRHIMRAVPRECDHINETWVSDRDRYSVHALYDDSRVYKPQIKQNGAWVEVEWQRALDEIADKLRGLISQHSADQVGGVAGTNATTEELYLLQKFMRGLGSNNIDHRLRDTDFSDQDQFPAYPGIALTLQEIERVDLIVLIGSNVRFEQPLLNHRINKAVTEGATVIAINSMAVKFNYPVKQQLTVPAAMLVHNLAEIAKVLVSEQGDMPLALQEIMPNEPAIALAKQLKQAKHPAFFLGEHALGHEQAAEIRQLVSLIAKHTAGTLNFLPAGANTAGAWLAGALPHRGAAGQPVKSPGLTLKQMLTSNPLKAYFVLNTEPELDSVYAFAAKKSLELASLVVCLTPFVSEAMREYADFILPISPFTETAGTFVNVTGEWQSFSAASDPHGEAKPAWKVLRVLANFVELPDFEYKSVHEVHAELRQQVEQMPSLTATFSRVSKITSANEFYRIGSWPIYKTDNLVRRSKPLQEIRPQEEKSLGLNSAMAKKIGVCAGERVLVSQGESQVILPLVINEDVADYTVYVPSGVAVTSGFGQAFAQVKIERA